MEGSTEYNKQIVRELAEEVARVLLADAVITAAELKEKAAKESQKTLFLDMSKIPLICNAITEIKRQLEEINQKFDKFVSKDSFTPVRLICYGLVGTIGAGIAVVAIEYFAKHVLKIG